MRKKLKIEEYGVLELSLYGKEYEVSFPNVEQVDDYSKKLKESGEGGEAALLLDFLDGLGLPKEASLKMQSTHLEMVVNALMPAKKK